MLHFSGIYMSSIPCTIYTCVLFYGLTLTAPLPLYDMLHGTETTQYMVHTLFPVVLVGPTFISIISVYFPRGSSVQFRKCGTPELIHAYKLCQHPIPDNFR